MKWWQTAVFYQVYLRSFADDSTNSDGIGDLRGLIGHLDYLKDLGIDAIWLSPHYPSQNFDYGYDVINYCSVAPEYGTLQEFRDFLDQAHQRKIRVITDFVLNHTSDQHPWFLESRSSRENSKRDWYIWRDGKQGGPPNNWYSDFGGSAWEFDEHTEQYYYHYFFKQQPDLNWRNSQVRQVMLDGMRFWLDFGVDGFRLTSVDMLLEEPELSDHTVKLTKPELYQAIFTTYPALTNHPNLAAQRRLMFQLQIQQPGIHAIMRELRTLVDQYPERVLIGETDDPRYFGKGYDELHLVFNFPLLRTFHLTPGWVRTNQNQWLASLPAGAWPANILGNHDASRLRTRFCKLEENSSQFNAELDRLFVTLLLTLRGTPFLYYGEEIGMTDLLLSDATEFQDELSRSMYRIQMEDFEVTPPQALRNAASLGRDKNRTPMQWTRAANAGFCPDNIRPWLPVNSNYAQGVNVADQSNDPTSLLHFYRRLLNLRRHASALMIGDYQPLLEELEDCMIYLRSTTDQVCLVALNFSDRLHMLDIPLNFTTAEVIFSSWGREGEHGVVRNLALAPYEIYIAQLS